MSAPFLTETRERFLKAILAKLPLASVREIYLFPPIKQGGVESGVAVVAVETHVTAAEAPTTQVEAETPPTEMPGEASSGGEPSGEESSAEDSVSDESSSGESLVESSTEESSAENSSSDESSAVEPSAEEPSVDQPAAGPAPEPPLERYTVYTAHYRLTLKGLDRGKWEHNVVAEADAPLLTIETVVRGVQRRAGDVDAPDHLTNEELRAALRIKDDPAPASAGGASAAP